MFEEFVDDPAIKPDGDSLGGSKVTSGLYKGATIKLAYATQADSGAKAVNLVLETDAKQTIRRTEYICSGAKKGGKNYYEKDGERHFLPGYTVMNDLCLLTTGKPLAQSIVMQKTIPLYSFDEKKEVPTDAQVITSLTGKVVNVGVIVQTVDKKAKNPAYNEAQPAGPNNQAYIATGETRDEVTISKFFHAADGRTVTECIAKAATGEFQTAWEEKWTGVVIDKVKGKKAVAGAIPGMPGAGVGNSSAPVVSETNLFAQA